MGVIVWENMEQSKEEYKKDQTEEDPGGGGLGSRLEIFNRAF